MDFNFLFPTRVIFGPGKLEKLATVKLPGKKALIAVTSDGIMKKLGYQDRVTQLLEKNNVEYVIYDKVQANPIKKGVMEAAELGRKEKCDFTIGLGGGSSIDTAKATALMLENNGDLWDYAYTGTGKRQKMKGALPIVAITTTAGTGTEADPWLVMSNEETGEKLDFNGEFLFPTLSIIDPELMLSVPAKLTAYQGMDAFFHVMEGYIATCSTPLSDMFALNAIELLVKNLPEAVNNGNNIQARTNVSYAANVLAGLVQFTSSCISLHILGQTLGGLYPKLPHGASLIVLAEKYFEKIANSSPEKFINVAKIMGMDVNNYSEKEQPILFVTALNEFMQKCCVSELKMSDYGIMKEELNNVAKISMNKRLDCDPYELTFEEIVSILDNSYK